MRGRQMMRNTISLCKEIKFYHMTTTTNNSKKARSASQGRRRRRPCKMMLISATILLCYLFTCCTHLITLAAAPQDTQTKWPQAQSSASSSSGPSELKLEDLRHNSVHKLMSEQDLRRTFQVDSHDQVPEYEVLKLTVNQDGSHLISPISDLGELARSSLRAVRSVEQRKRRKRSTTAAYKDKDKDDDVERSGDMFADAKATRSKNPENNVKEEEDKLIVMSLSTFGKNFKLRLKRNVDFQKRIKDMKMFMAESTKDGQLRYTEIKNNNQQQQQHHKQEPHKRAAAVSELIQETADALNIEPSATSSSSKLEPGLKKTGNVWNIGSTYHDEDNLAALLIDHDRKTGQLQVDGTIGNDFVIKPMPQATIDALVFKQRAEQLDRLNGSASSEQLQQDSRNHLAAKDKLLRSPANKNLDQISGASLAANLSAKALHMHDDDPHDDDEMFLDEDEALELAHHLNQQSTINTTAAQTTHQTNHQLQLPQAATRALSKAAAERKWRKYRKLMAQTQVPKLDALSAGSGAGDVPAPVSVPDSAQVSSRARRHAHAPKPVRGGHREKEEEGEVVQVSHHIVYRQKPSSEESSSEHQHSFMISPQTYKPSGSSMERVAASFSSQRLSKRSTDNDMIEPQVGLRGDEERLAQRLEHQVGASRDNEELTDNEHDPLGGQFYLEPGTIMGGLERAGYSDWSLMGVNGGVGGGSHLAALPPYANVLNGTLAHSTGDSNQTRHRFKRHINGANRLQRQATNLRQVRRKRQAPDTVWPEVLLVVDYDSFLLHGGDSRDVKRYFVSFWNGVDLRYKLLVHPHIRISLAGMIVAKDRDATPYLERNRLRAPNADAVDAAGALTDMGKYLYREDRLPTYDLAVVITKLDMCRRRYEGGRCNRGTAGFAYVGGACVVNKRLEKVNSVAIIEDSGGFSGIIVAAHEVGHLLGCVHDGSPPPSYLGGPGATHCPWEDGFIMSDLRHTERGFRWSQCSVEQFKHFLNGETATCLYNYPHESQMLHRLLPGTMLSLDEQCKRDRGTNACFKDARVCAQLFCFDSASGYCVSYRPAAEGSPCGEGQVCRNGKCVGEIENIIPDYSHQSQTVVAATSTRRQAHSMARLADNGISASSTSTATSSPDNKSTNQLSSRMDTFPVDTPSLISSYPLDFGARQQIYTHDSLRHAASSPSGATSGSSSPTTAKATTKNSNKQSNGHQRQQTMISKGASNQPHNSLYANNLGQQSQPTSNNLLATSSKLSASAQQLYDNQRILYGQENY